MSTEQLFEDDFHTIAGLVEIYGQDKPDHPALIHDDRVLTYRQLNDQMDRVASALQRDGVDNRDVIAICATGSIEYVVTFLGALRAGVTVTPLAPSSTAESLAVMLADCGAKLFFTDAGVAKEMAGVLDQVEARRIALDGSDAGEAWAAWLAPEGSSPGRWRSIPTSRSTSSIRPAPPARPRASSSRTRCAGCMYAAASITATR